MGVDCRGRGSMASRNLSFFITKTRSWSLFIFLSHFLTLSFLFPSLSFYFSPLSSFSVYLPLRVAEWILFVSHRYSRPGSVVVRPPKLSPGRFMFPPLRKSGLIPFCCEMRALTCVFLHLRWISLYVKSSGTQRWTHLLLFLLFYPCETPPISLVVLSNDGNWILLEAFTFQG